MVVEAVRTPTSSSSVAAAVAATDGGVVNSILVEAATQRPSPTINSTNTNTNTNNNNNNITSINNNSTNSIDKRRSFLFVCGILFYGLLQESLSRHFIPFISIECYIQYRNKITVASTMLEIVVCCILEKNLWQNFKRFMFRFDTLKMSLPALFHSLSMYFWRKGPRYISIAVYNVFFYTERYFVIALLSVWLLPNARFTFRQWIGTVKFGIARCLVVIHAFHLQSIDINRNSYSTLYGLLFVTLATFFHGLAYVLLELFMKVPSTLPTVTFNLRGERGGGGGFALLPTSETDDTMTQRTSNINNNDNNTSTNTTRTQPNNTEEGQNVDTQQMSPVLQWQNFEQPSIWMRNMQFAFFSMLFSSFDAWNQVNESYFFPQNCTLKPAMATMCVMQAIMGLLAIVMIYHYGALAKSVGFDYGSLLFFLFLFGYGANAIGVIEALLVLISVLMVVYPIISKSATTATTTNVQQSESPMSPSTIGDEESIQPRQQVQEHVGGETELLTTQLQTTQSSTTMSVEVAPTTHEQHTQRPINPVMGAADKWEMSTPLLEDKK